MVGPKRKSPRLRGFDYRGAESYFVTVCLRDRSDLFGHVTNDARIVQSDIGNMIALTWIAIPDQFDPVLVDDFVVMPDHVHGLISIDCDEVPSGSMSLSEVIGWFKGKTTHLYGKGVADRGWPRYRGHLWQPRFHDHIIRDERDYESRVKYIEGNPARWVESRSARSERE